MRGTAPTRDEIFEALDEVKDPEVPVLSVVELGIVRDARVDESGITVVVTPTYSGCPAMRVIEQQIIAAIESRGWGPAAVETVYSPAWTTDWIPAAARRKLEAYGIAPPGKAEADATLVPLLRKSGVVRCPYCAATNTELRSEFGSTACKSIRYCRECRQPFEQFKAI